MRDLVRSDSGLNRRAVSGNFREAAEERTAGRVPVKSTLEGLCKDAGLG